MSLIAMDILREAIDNDDMTLIEFNVEAERMGRVAQREMELLERIAGLETLLKLEREDASC
jgi:hypothetical protein